jgi:hypothetical protein
MVGVKVTVEPTLTVVGENVNAAFSAPGTQFKTCSVCRLESAQPKTSVTLRRAVIGPGLEKTTDGVALVDVAGFPPLNCHWYCPPIWLGVN